MPPLSVFWSEQSASIVFLPSITWYLSTSAVDRRADLVVVLVEGRVGRREERVLAAREVDAVRREGRGELVEVVVALDVGLVVAEEHAVRAPEDLRALHRGEGVGDGRLDLRGGLGGRDGREGRDGRGEGVSSASLAIL